MEITNHPPKRLKKDPYWDEITETGDKRHCKLCNKAYSLDTGLSTIKSHFKHNHVERYNELMIAIKANVELFNTEKILQINSIS